MDGSIWTKPEWKWNAGEVLCFLCRSNPCFGFLALERRFITTFRANYMVFFGGLYPIILLDLYIDDQYLL